MYSQRVHVFPSGNFGGSIFDAFEEMMGLTEAVSKFPEGLVCGDFPPNNVLIDKDENLVLQMAIAGYPESGVELSYEDDHLWVALTPDEKQFDEYKVKMKGIRNSKAKKGFLVPSTDYDGNKIKATFQNGILNVVIPRRPETKPVVIKITT